MGWLSGRGRGQCGDGDGTQAAPKQASPNLLSALLSFISLQFLLGENRVLLGEISSVSWCPQAGGMARRGRRAGRRVLVYSPRMLEPVWRLFCGGQGVLRGAEPGLQSVSRLQGSFMGWIAAFSGPSKENKKNK